MTNLAERKEVESSLFETFSKSTMSYWGWFTVVVGFCGFLLWAAFAPLDNGTAIPGTVIVAGQRQVVDATSSGIVKTLLVKEGDEVKKGQVVMELDQTVAQNTQKNLDAQHKTLQSKIARLQAERLEQDQINFPQVLQQDVSVEAITAVAAQQQLFSNRRSTLQSELQAIRTNIEGQKSLLVGLQNAVEQKKVQAQILHQQLNNIHELANQGYVPRNRLLELQRQYSQIHSEISHDTGVIGQTGRQIAELQLQVKQRKYLFLQQVNDELASSQVQLEDVSSKLRSANFELAHYQIRAPSTGIVVGLNVHTVGAMVSLGNRMMDIVPLDVPLIVEGQLPVHQIDQVQKGLPVELLFSAFNQSSTPRIGGVVGQVSADRLTDEKTAIPYYGVQIIVNKDQLQHLHGQSLTAGMPVEIFVKTGERSLLNYLFKPLLDRSKTSWGDS